MVLDNMLKYKGAKAVCATFNKSSLTPNLHFVTTNKKEKNSDFAFHNIKSRKVNNKQI